MPLTAATREAMALTAAGLGNWVSLHTADPGSTGANEATGGSPAYARKQTTFTGGAADGNVPGTDVLIDVPAGTYAYAGLWSAATGGTFIGADLLRNPADGTAATFTPTLQAQLKVQAPTVKST